VPSARALHDRAGDVPLSRRLLRCPPSLRATRVNGALEQLGTRDREVIALASRAGLAVSEIAERLGLTAAEVQASMRQALQLVRRELDHTLRREAP
jgi:DNA-directed RNA polymerase specialized sigma24 family protein